MPLLFFSEKVCLFQSCLFVFSWNFVIVKCRVSVSDFFGCIAMTDLERFEFLKKKVDTIKVKKLAAESESQRLSQELEEKKKEIRSVYGVEITDFSKAIEDMKSEIGKKLDSLEAMVSEAEEKIGGVL